MDMAPFGDQWPGTDMVGDFGLRVTPTDSVTITRVVIESFGYLHEDSKPLTSSSSHLVIDVRNLFRDPHVTPALRYSTGRDDAVRANVLDQVGALEFVRAQAAAIAALVPAATPNVVTVAVGCAGGRHRSVVIAEALALLLAGDGIDAEVYHRDIRRPVVQR
ncbi:putative P-loop ATPase protein [Amycolatopsis keratiniphila]|uniref:Putative P-loop ATPase protein n=2 Tax=Amycolatopsis keratiniphila TaxID=129921 RepID=R4TIR8_9PSEU|nr:putative P-loop ATPase protein [Amycolatopsis keratiniphila]